ncbi:class I SAM-dependent methyltransferase [Phenylobacterium sp.]|uniref:class I SAM-dependent methyltransferase n=1 Tax=Phenylobacterium sp. TaxID=1871053 RepID=UPI002FC65451
MTQGYHESRLAKDARRDVVWKALWSHYFRHRISPGDCVLDLGCGYGEFINNVVAKTRLALDLWARMPEHVAAGVEAHVGSVTDLGWIADSSVDFAFASNLFEHVTQQEFAAALDALRPKLAARGSLTILQPNYRYAYREYFDDYTHVAVYTHVSLADFLTAHGWEVLDVRPRFLPLTVKSRLPVWPALIAAYLWSPIKPLGKQMLVRARPSARG